VSSCSPRLPVSARTRTGLIGQIIRERGDEISDFELGDWADGVFHRRPRDERLDARLGTAVLLENRELWNA